MRNGNTSDFVNIFRLVVAAICVVACLGAVVIGVVRGFMLAVMGWPLGPSAGFEFAGLLIFAGLSGATAIILGSEA